MPADSQAAHLEVVRTPQTSHGWASVSTGMKKYDSMARAEEQARKAVRLVEKEGEEEERTSSPLHLRPSRPLALEPSLSFASLSSAPLRAPQELLRPAPRPPSSPSRLISPSAHTSSSSPPRSLANLDMSSEWDETCLVCGIKTKHRCSKCAEAGISLYFCSPDHQKLVRPLSLPPSPFLASLSSAS